ncbi:hypothetical protein NO995_08315 [Aestuariibaculum sp. M13]|uniref:hypothetical protein n=1 Tax=Aestuariibaculum sp. M13 TaxID=2967132 RepID=UPI002159FC21|nr:hypothetical protein [Aestuariibaculum sp. M13]MCR8667683.1 hypothetical protein [Aestuariibaculum sp. M13]
MKKMITSLKAIIITILLTMLIQSCTTYKAANVSLNKAVKSELKVKVTKTDGKKEKFARIEIFNDGQYYGLKKIRANEYSNILIDTNTVKKVQLYDKTNSIIQSVALPVVVIGSVIAIRESVINSIGF